MAHGPLVSLFSDTERDMFHYSIYIFSFCFSKALMKTRTTILYRVDQFHDSLVRLHASFKQTVSKILKC